MDELFPIVDEQGCVVGSATRKMCHGGSFLLHPVVHLHVFNSAGELYLQHRAPNKDIQPDKWDTAVGGHVDYGETPELALRREAWEELGIEEFVPHAAFKYPFRSTQEYELVNTFVTRYDGAITPNADEISEGRFWSLTEIESQLGCGVFTPNFEQEFERLKQYLSHKQNID